MLDDSDIDHLMMLHTEINNIIRANFSNVHTIYLWTSPTTCYNRAQIRARPAESELEIKNFVDVHDAHEKALIGEDVIVVDGERCIEDIADDVVGCINEFHSSS